MSIGTFETAFAAPADRGPGSIDQSGAAVDERAVRDVVEAWFAGWSPGDGAWNGDHFRAVFTPGRISVVDDMGGSTLTLDSVDAYIATWAPFMAQFEHWSISPVDPVALRVSGNLAVATFSFQADARDRSGRAILPKPGQHATLVLEKHEGRWVVVREHLTTLTHNEAQ